MLTSPWQLEAQPASAQIDLATAAIRLILEGDRPDDDARIKLELLDKLLKRVSSLAAFMMLPPPALDARAF